MKLYILTNTSAEIYCVYEYILVVSDSEENARLILPITDEYEYRENSWCKPEELEVEYIGIADTKYKNGDIVCFSYYEG